MYLTTDIDSEPVFVLCFIVLNEISELNFYINVEGLSVLCSISFLHLTLPHLVSC